MKYPVEALLRAPVEFWSASTFIAASTLMMFLPGHLPLPRSFSWIIAVLFLALASLRLKQGISILNYQRNLLNNQQWTLKPTKIPQKRGMIFLGEGFRWTQKHTQRLIDTKRPECQKFLVPKQKFITNWMKLRKLETDTRKMPISGRAEMHGVETKKQTVWLNSADRVGHTLVLGTTRVGKTRLAELLIAQDIRKGHVVLVFDPKGDTDLLLRMYAEARRWGRESQFRMFHLGYPETSCRYNAIGRFSRITEVATRIASQLPSSGSSSAFREFAWRFVNIIAHALVALGQVPNYIKIRKYINDIEPLFIEYARNFLMRTQAAGWASEVKLMARSINQRNLTSALKGRDAEAVALYQYIQSIQVDDPVLEGLVSAFKYDRTYFDKIVSSVGPLMEKLTTGPVSELISPSEENSDPRPQMEWLNVIRSRGIVYVGLDALSDSTVAAAVGNSMFADLVSVAGYLYKFGVNGENQPFEQPPRVCIHADEFNELIGEEFVPLLNKSGGTGFQITAYTQTISDVEVRVGSRAKSGQVTGNFNTLIMLRVKELATAELLTKQLPKVEVRGLSGATGASDTSDSNGKFSFVARNEDRLSVSEESLLNPSDIVSLPRGQAYALLEGGFLWKVKFPLPSKNDRHMPGNLLELMDELKRSYSLGDIAVKSSDSHQAVA